MNDARGQSIDGVLRELLKQGRLDPAGAEKLAAQGIDRLRTFLGGDTTATPTGTTTPAGPAVPVEDLTGALGDHDDHDDPAGDEESDGFLEHTVPLRGGRSAHVVVPGRFTRADADRIAGVLAALALDDEDEASAGGER